MNDTGRSRSMVFLFLFVVICFFAVGGYIYWLKLAGNPKSVALKTFEGKEVHVFDKAAKFGDENNNRKLFVPYEDGFFEKYIQSDPDYLYSVAEDGTRSKTDGGKYLLCCAGRYFLIEHTKYTKVTSFDDSLEETEYECYYYDELYGQFYISSTKETNYIFMPAVIDNRLFRGDVTHIEWKDTCGLSSFEDLKEYYGRIGNEYYTIDEENKCILLNDAKDPSKKTVARIYATDEGIKITSAVPMF
jgi:hypothetical protein